MGTHERRSGAHRRIVPPRLWRRRSIVIGVVMAMLLALGVAGAIASNPNDQVIDMTYSGAEAEVGGGWVLQGGSGAGTGNWDPFLTLSANTPTESGYNTIKSLGEFDTFFGGGRTHVLNAAAVPVLEYGGSDYREFGLDANDQGSDTYMSIDKLEVWIVGDHGGEVSEWSGIGSGFDYPGGLTQTLIWDNGIKPILMVSQGLESGSGVSDISILVPNDLFPCEYGDTSCTDYVVMYMDAGGASFTPETVDIGEFNKNDAADYDWDVSAGFEEWRTQLTPVVHVTKTAETSLTRTWTWTINKEQDDSWALFTGESGTSDFDVNVDATSVDSNRLVTGTISIENPTGGTLISERIPAVINSVDDVITQGLISTTATVDCGVTYPYTLGAGDTLTCSYTASPPNSDTGTNTATVNIDINDEGDTRDYVGTADFDFLTGTVDDVDEEVTVTDDHWTPGVPGDDVTLGTVNALTDTLPYYFSTYSRTFTCDDDEGSHTNRASFVTNDTSATGSSSATVTVACYDISVSKDASTSLTRTWTWTINKVEDDSWALFTGESGTSDFDVNVNASSTDSNWGVAGAITVTNNHPTRVAVINSLSDVVSPAIAATVDCGVTFPYEIAANGGTLSCSYSASLPDASSRTNTATATQQLYTFDSSKAATADGTTNYSGNADVVFDSLTSVDDVDEEVTVTDDHWTPGVPGDDVTLGTVNALTDTLPYYFSTYSRTFTCDDDEGSHTNRASFVTNDTSATGSSSATVTVACYDISVSKDASTSLTRTWTWTINKVEDDSWALFTGESGTSDFDVNVNASSTDSNWGVAGAITVTNNHPTRVAVINSLSDVVSPAIAATVDCGVTFPYEIAANGGTLSCSYSASLPDASSRTNTATATQQLYTFDSSKAATADGTTNYSGNADVDFSGASINQVDEQITVTDDYGTPGDTSDDVDLGTVNALTDTLPYWLYYDRTFTIDDFPYCGDHYVINTAKFVTNDTGTFDVDSWTILFHIPCNEGLTPGFWQGGNGLFRWDKKNDNDFDPVHGNPFYASQLWKDQTVLYGNSSDGHCDPDFHPICEMTMLDIVGSGGTSDWVRKAARDAIAAVLNSAHAGVNYPASVATIQSDWYDALHAYIDSGGTDTSGLEAFHTKYAAYNQLGGTI
jgi:uncharacterized protein (DUF2344 family)